MKEWYMDRTIKRMGPEEKKGMMNGMMDRFFESLTPVERKELMDSMMPRMMDKMFEGMSAEDRMELMASMMPRMMSRMFGGGEGAPGVAFKMPVCGGKEGTEGTGGEPAGDFKPWEMCPCREYCAQGRKAAQATPESAAPAGQGRDGT